MMIVSAMMMAMLMPSLESSAQAQGRGRNHERVERNEVRGRNNRADYRRPSDKDRRPNRVAYAPKPKERHINHFVPRGGRLVKCAPLASAADVMFRDGKDVSVIITTAVGDTM